MQKKSLFIDRNFIIFMAICFAFIILAFIVTGRDWKGYHYQTNVETPVYTFDDGEQMYTFTIDEPNGNERSLMFFTTHYEVKVYENDKLVYELVPYDSIWGHTTGCVWNFVSNLRDKSEVRVEMIPCYKEVNVDEMKFYIGNERNMALSVFYSGVVPFLACLFIFLIGVILIICWFLIRKRLDMQYHILALGLFSVILGLWSGNETMTASIILYNRLASSYAAFVLLTILPTPFAMFMRGFLGIKEKWLWKIICICTLTLFVTENILQMCNVVDMRQIIVIIQIHLVVTFIYGIGCIVYRIIKKQMDMRVWLCLIGGVFLILSTIMDITLYYRHISDANGCGRLAFMIYIIVLGIESSRQAAMMMKKGQDARAIEEFAKKDAMTGMYNRNAYDQYCVAVDRPKEQAIVVFDLNNLKCCNDVYGHKIGDAYIITAAELIRDCFEKYGVCYRIGGDEFCCIVANKKSFRFERVRDTFIAKQSIKNSAKELPIEIHIALGYAGYELERDTIESMRDRADVMMYQDKEAIKKNQTGKY